MKKTLATAFSAMFLLGTGVAAAQEKDGFASEGGLGTTRLESTSGGDLGSVRYTEVEWTYLKNEKAYGYKLSSAKGFNIGMPPMAMAICAPAEAAQSLLQFEIQMARAGDGKTQPVSKLRAVKMGDYSCRTFKGNKNTMITSPGDVPGIFIVVEAE